MKNLEDYIRTIPDFPEPGIMFRDITTVFQDADGLKLAIDFGSNQLTVFTEHKGITLTEPSLMITDAFSGAPIAIGKSAKKMLGKLPASMKAVTPVKDGIVYDYAASCRMLRTYLNRLCAGRLFKPDVLMSVPGNVTPLQRKTLFDAVTED